MVTAGPPDGSLHGVHQPVSRQRPIGLGAQPQEVFDIARRARQRAGRDVDGVPPQLPGAPRDGQHRIGAQHRVVHHPAGTDLAPPHLKLRLHHGNDIRVGRSTSSQRGQHGRQRDERQVGHHQFDAARRSPRATGRERWSARRRPPADRTAQRPGQLAVAHVGGNHLGRATVQQHFGESARRRAGVQAAAALDGNPEGVQRADEFVRAARHPAAFAVLGDGQGRGDGDGGARLDGRQAVDAHLAGADQLRGLLTGSGQAAPHQLDVNAGTSRHARTQPFSADSSARNSTSCASERRRAISSSSARTARFGPVCCARRHRAAGPAALRFQRGSASGSVVIASLR